MSLRRIRHFPNSSLTAYPKVTCKSGLLLCTSLALLLTSGLVSAQETPSSDAPAGEEAKGTDSAAVETEETAEAKEVVISEKARSHFRAGVNLLQDPDGARYEEAYRQFVIAYKDSPSWKILSNLGLTAMKLERDGEAIEAFGTYLKEGGDQLTADERSQITRDLETLQASVSTLELTTTPAGVRLIDERLSSRGNVTNEYTLPEAGPLTLQVRAGRHKITARLSGHEDIVWEFQGDPSSSHSYAFELHPPADAATPVVAASIANNDQGQPETADSGNSGTSALRIGSYIGLGVGVAGLALGTVFALNSKKASNRVKELCVGDPATDCQVDEGSDEAEEVNQQNDKAGSNQTLAIVGFAVGGAALATGVTLFILSMKSGKSTAQLQHERDTQRHWTPYAGLGELGVSGRF